MSLSASVPEVSLRDFDLHSRAHSATAAWFEVSRQELASWNHVLLETETSLYQYPFWNEPYRPLLLTPRYLAWGTPECPLAFVSILTVGFGAFKVGLVFRGPTCIQSTCALCQPAVADLVDWAKDQGYIFIRFTHSDAGVLNRITECGHTERFDAFPYFLDYPVLSPDYIVHQYSSEEETLDSFDREVRRKLRRAAEKDYEFHAEDSAEALASAWPLYQECSRRKHFRLERPLSVYQETMRLARRHDCVRLYSLRMKGKTVGSTLVFRDRNTAHCLLAAFEVHHRHAAVLLHWRAMRDMYRQGVTQYNMGPAPGSLVRFKSQFCSQPTSYPGAVTLVLNENLFGLWKKAIFPVAKRLRPMLRKLVSCVSF
jgi:hypothetical protein